MSIALNIESVREKILGAEQRAGREANTVRLMAVSKFNPASSIVEALNAGLCLFGENRVQEACEKFPDIIAKNLETELHLIGSLQRNKVRSIVPIVTCIQSVDRLELLSEIEKQACTLNCNVQVLFEFHTGEESKSGYTDLDTLFRSIDNLESMTHVRPAGLMTMAPFTNDTHVIRESFKLLAKIQAECSRRYPVFNFNELSMGMSADFEIAIEEGSTLVRIGRAIFGERT